MGRCLFVSCMLLSLLTQGCGTQTPIESARPEEELEYRYRTAMSEDPRLCKHMERVFNAQFRMIWRTEPMPSPGPSSPYSSSGKFAFQRIEGVEHDERTTYDMSLSKWPSSPEFDAIPWRETRVTTGAPPNMEVPQSDTPRPALTAYVDFDNDGVKDTVIKYGFTAGYAGIRYRGDANEYLSIWSGTTAPVAPNTSLWSLHHGARERPAVRVNGQYLRPLTYAGRTYVASYEVEFEPPESGSASPGTPTRETMTLLEFQPGRTGGTVCQFQMIQIH